jgi:hypothetical protein
MTTFGTSAYLKLLAFNAKPRDTEIRKRLTPQNGGYDFHKAMRQIATAYASGTASWAETAAKLKAIKNPAERKSATSAAKVLINWVGGRQICFPRSSDLHAVSPNGIYSVKFSPDFEIDIDGTITRIHIWNTLQPDINLRSAIGTLGLFVPEDRPNSIGVLSLRSKELFLPADFKSARDLAKFLALDIEKRFARITDEKRERPTKDRGSEKGIGV